jgi:hypothetical protein
MKKIFILFALISFQSWGSASAPTDDGWTDTESTIKLMLRGSYLQFTTRNNLYYLGAGTAASMYAFKHDDRIASLMATKDIKNIINHIGDTGVFLSFPFAAMGTWYLGKTKKDTKLQRFAMEYAAAMYLALGESGLLSYIQIHERPSPHNISFWEKEFRGNSSWPSGHVIPYSTLFFKTLQFYGPAWSTIPLLFTIASGLQRMQDGKHYASDIVGAFFFSAFASEGVRKAANYSGNHSFYKKWLEHDTEVGMLYYKKSWGPKVSFSF